MASTYTLNNGIELIGTGEQSGTWGDTTNTNFELLDTSLDGQVSVTLSATGSTGSPNTLPVSDGAASNGRNRLVIFGDSGDIGGTVYVQLTPNDAEKIIYVRNNLSGSRSILLFQGTYNASNDYEVPAGTTAVVFFNGAGTGAVAANVFNNAHFDGLNLVGNLTVTGNIVLGDNNKAIFGAGSDLQIYHNSANNKSYIEESGSGNLVIRGSDIDILAGNGEAAINVAQDGAVTLYYNNTKTFETTSTGIDVTGTITTDELTVDTSDQVIINHSASGGGIRIDSTNGTNTGSLRFGDDTDNYIGALEYNHTNDAMTMYVNNATRMTINSSGNVGIGATSPARKLDVAGNNNAGAKANYIRITDTDTTATANNQAGGIEFFTNDVTPGIAASIEVLYAGSGGGGELTFNTNASSSGTLTEAVRIDENGSVGIGTSAPLRNLQIGNHSGAQQALSIQASTTGKSDIFLGDGTGSGEYAGLIRYDHASDFMAFWSSSSERMRIDSSGNVGIGTSSPATPLDVTKAGGGNFVATFQNTTSATPYGMHIKDAASGANGYPLFQVTDSAGTSPYLVVHSGTGNVLIAGVGGIGAATGDLAIYSTASGHEGLRFGNGAIVPTNNAGASTDNACNLGGGGGRFTDIYATNGTIQTSDRNEKQQIASLTDAEMTAAKAISALYKTFKWNDSVAENGDNARTHTGVIAQEAETALIDAGLDAGDYAFFISTTWWETQTDVPAVEADEENGIEAAAAYTRTDTYDTAEEAPEGSTERNRKGIRYPELLAFVGAATEQRLASIETRLTALEGA